MAALHIDSISRRKKIIIPEELRPEPPKRNKKWFYILIIFFIMSIIGFLFYRNFLTIKCSGLVVGKVIVIRSPIKGKIGNILEEGTFFSKKKLLVSISPIDNFDEINLLKNKERFIRQVINEYIKKKELSLLKRKDIQKELQKVRILYQRKLIFLSEKMNLEAVLDRLENQIATFDQIISHYRLLLFDIKRAIKKTEFIRKTRNIYAVDKGFVLENFMNIDSFVFPGDNIMRISVGTSRFILAYWPLKYLHLTHIGMDVIIQTPNGLSLRGKVEKIFPEAVRVPPYLVKLFESRDITLPILICVYDHRLKNLTLGQPVKIIYYRFKLKK